MAHKRPNPDGLLDGQVALNYNAEDPGMFFRVTDGTLTKVGPVSVTYNGLAPNATPVGSTGNALGEEWLDGRSAYYKPVLKIFDADACAGLGWVPGNGFYVDDETGNFSLDRVMYLRTMEADGVGEYSYIRVPQGPTTDEVLIDGQQGMIRLDSDIAELKYHDGTEWIRIVSEGFDGNLGDINIDNLFVTGDTTLGDGCAKSTVDINGVLTVNCQGTYGANDTQRSFFRSMIDAQSRVSMVARSQLRFYTGSNVSTYVGLRAPTTVSGSVMWNMPPADGNTGGKSVLHTDGEGSLYFARKDGGDAEFDNIHIHGNSILGDDCVDSSVTIGGELNVLCNTTIGVGCTNTLTVKATTTFDCPVTFNNDVNFPGGIDGHFLPSANCTYDLGSPDRRWRNVYTCDLHLQNERGDWTIVEEEDMLTIFNNKKGKKYKILMEEID